MTEYIGGKITLFRKDFIKALKEFGVINIDYCNTLIKSTDDGTQYKNYKTANIIGK
jgi:hypothetical protein